MSMTTEQVKRLRSEAAGMILQNGTTARLLREAAETIERAVICGAQEPCPNAISRSDMLDAIGHGTTYTSEDLQKIIKALPPVNPQPKTEQFAKWVAEEIFDDNWEYNKDAFAEIACRKLAKLGIVRKNGNEWELVESQEGSEKE